MTDPHPVVEREEEGVLGEVIVCQGPPRCALRGDDAVAAAEAGCVWCRRITIHEDGTETTQEPVET